MSTPSLPETMRAVVLDGPGPPEALQIRQLPVPVPALGWPTGGLEIAVTFNLPHLLHERRATEGPERDEPSSNQSVTEDTSRAHDPGALDVLPHLYGCDPRKQLYWFILGMLDRLTGGMRISRPGRACARTSPMRLPRGRRRDSSTSRRFLGERQVERTVPFFAIPLREQPGRRTI